MRYQARNTSKSEYWWDASAVVVDTALTNGFEAYAAEIVCMDMQQAERVAFALNRLAMDEAKAR
jgi:hypothetical protein